LAGAFGGLCTPSLRDPGIDIPGIEGSDVRVAHRVDYPQINFASVWLVSVHGTLPLMFG
jgi:hypothetical protein